MNPEQLTRKDRTLARDLIPTGYNDFLKELKSRIRETQLRAALSANRELVMLYWQIGQDILTRQHEQDWGAKIIDRLSQDLRHAFPTIKGFSVRNLKYMRKLAEAYPDPVFVQQAVAQIPWGHNCRILDRIKDPKERAWYLHQTLHYGWGRDILLHQIESGLYQRQGRAVTNFDQALPAPQSDLARQTIKDHYLFDFLDLGPESRERDLERGLLNHIRDFLLELGLGFAFLGSQYRLPIGDQDYFLDLLFYHVRLRCYVVVELKIGEFKPEYAGKMNFYLSAVDDLLRAPDDQPSIGLLLCKTRNHLVAEYALRDMNKPMGVATYKLLPAQIRDGLPSLEELEAGLAGDDTQSDVKSE